MRIATLAAALVLAVTAASAPAGAQDAGGEDTTTTTTTSSTIVDPTVTTPPLDPTSTTTTLPPDPEDPVRDIDAPVEEVPVVDVTVPPRPGATEADAEAARVVRRELRVAEAELRTAESAHQEAADRVTALEDRLLELRARFSRLSRAKRDAIYRHDKARELFEERAADALIRGDAGALAALLESSDPNEAGRRAALMSSVLDEDDRIVAHYLSTKRDLSGGLARAAEELADVRRDLTQAREVLKEAQRQRDLASVYVAVFAAGGEIVIHGFVFPVAKPYSFGDSFGAPRMPGTEYEHAHQGTDILAPAGTALLACERGIVTKMGTDLLGGTKLWIKGESGTYYYYAHLSAFEEGVVDGTVVEAGDVVGYVGDTGNAKGGPAHLHFEIHPDGGPAVNPYPLLAVVAALAPDD